MHSLFRKRIAETVIATKKKGGKQAAREYAQRIRDKVDDEEWEELVKLTKSIRKAGAE